MKLLTWRMVFYQVVLVVHCPKCSLHMRTDTSGALLIYAFMSHLILFAYDGNYLVALDISICPSSHMGKASF